MITEFKITTAQNGYTVTEPASHYETFQQQYNWIFPTIEEMFVFLYNRMVNSGKVNIIIEPIIKD